MAFLSVRGLRKSYAATPVLQDFDLDVAQGHIACLLGASGCGKTTLLRLLAGIERADSGRIRLAGRDVQALPPHTRRIGLMFQDHALFPHQNVGANIAYGLRMRRWGRPAIRARVTELLALVRLTGYEKRPVQELSGGESQRVALARSLAPNPRLLLLDEPLASLDRQLRDELVREIRGVLRALSITALYVTHDQEEAFAIADQVALMHAGRIIRTGEPQALYRDPGSVYVARFLRMANAFSLRQADALPAWLRAWLNQRAPGAQDAFVLIRPDALAVAGAYPGEELIRFQARVRAMTFRGRIYEAQLEAPAADGKGWSLTLDVPVAETCPRMIERWRQATVQGGTVSLTLRAARIQTLRA